MERARDWIRQVRDERLDLVRVSDADLQRATDIFFSFVDKAWSFTDCTSRVVMERLGIQRAFAFDEHFRQFGTVAVLPD
jgi:predicted nucleic acid-binding protein